MRGSVEFVNATSDDGDLENGGSICRTFDMPSGDVTVEFNFATLITNVDITATVPEVGVTPETITYATTPSGSGTFTTMPSARRYEVKNGSDWEQTSSAFQSGKEYRAYLKMDVQDGYRFDEDCAVTLNGESISGDELTFTSTNMEVTHSFGG